MLEKPKAYIETSVVSYRVARPSQDVTVASHQKITRAWWEKHLHEYDACLSAFVLQEIQRGDPDAVAERLKVAAEFSILPASAEVDSLAIAYMAELPLPEKALYDAFHIAVASVCAMDYLITWNCKHIANAHLRRGIAEINLRMGVSTPIICTPEELLDDDTIPEPVL